MAPQLKGNWVMLRYTHQWTKENAPTGKVFIDLPQGVTCISAIGMPFTEAPLPSGGVRVTLDPVNFLFPELKGGCLYLATTLTPGAAAKGRVWAEWDGGKCAETEFDVRVADVPPVRQPKKLWAGAAMWPYMIANCPDYYRQYASMGFNHMNLWHGAIHSTDKVHEDVVDIVTKAREVGISTSIDSSTSWGPETWGGSPDTNALALFTDGTRSGPCPSYRGPAYEAWLASRARIAASGISFILSDEETYGTGNFSTACVCPRCEARWKDWLKANRPGMAYISPRDVIAMKASAPAVVAFDKLSDARAGSEAAGAVDPGAEIESQNRAWLSFRASLTTERYRFFKQELARAVDEFGAKSSPEPMLGWWAAAAEDYTLAVCMQDGRALSRVIDPVVPQLYFRYKMPPATFRENVRRHAWATQGRALWAGIDSDDYDTGFANTPGVLTAAVLETFMAGGKGYCMWAGAYMDTRQWAELSAVNGVIARHEKTFLDGTETDLFRAHAPEGKGDYFHPWSKEVFVSTRETKREGLVLISDYRAERAPFRVERSTAYAGPMTLTDAFTGVIVVTLAADEWDFRVHLANWPVKLLCWKKG